MKRFARIIYEKLYLKIFPNYPMELERAVGDCRTLLDVGCGAESPIRNFSAKLGAVGVDGHGPSIEKSQKLAIHGEYVQMDLLGIGGRFGAGSFECVLASDLIEHLKKEDGFKLLGAIEAIASRRVIVYTPNGFLPQKVYDDNPWQEHRSGWTAEELRHRGYRVMGINGWKPLRGELSDLRFKPKIFWRVVSDLTQSLVRDHPEKAFQLLCVKDKG